MEAKYADPAGEAFVDCVKALAELVTATVVLNARILNMQANAGKPDLMNHAKATQQAANRVKNALDKVLRGCTCVWLNYN